jgi:hypothetical protein
MLQPALENGTGMVVRLLTRGWLPYSLDCTLRVTESRHPYGLPWRLKETSTVEEFGDSFEKAPVSIFAMIGKSRPTSRCSGRSLLPSNLPSKPTIAGPWNKGRRASHLSWHDGAPAAVTTWPPYLCRQGRHGSRRSCCGCSVPPWFWPLALAQLWCFGFRRRGRKP